AVSQKRLRNDDSIDMLEIIRDSGSFDVGCVYGWTSEFYMLIHIQTGSGKKIDIASQVDKHLDKINKSIEKTMELFD
ncbi:MAG: hypothetical protein FWD23_03400, partial [Oscillospiraceae bacterium]|nr:hypothetical protein [Oscillospiraceae bacterium]